MTAEEKLAADARPPGESSSVAGQIAKASLAITVIILLCKLMGGVEKFLLLFIYKDSKADRFQMDLYLAVAVLVVLFYDIMRYSIIPALLPALVRVRDEGGEERSVQLAGSFANVLALAIVPVLALAAFFPGALSWIFVRPSSADYAQETVLFRDIFRIMLPAGIFLVLGGVTYCLLQSRKRFAASAFGDLAYKIFGLIPLLAVIGLVALGGPARREWALRHGIYYIAIGVCVGALGLLLIQLLALWRDRGAYRFRIDHRDPAFRGVWREAAWPLLYALLFLGARRVLDIYFGFSFNEANNDRGYYTGLELSYRLVEVPFRFLVEPLAYALFPFLVAQRVASDWKGFSKTLDGGLRSMFLILLPISAFLFLLRGPVVAILVPDDPAVARLVTLPLTFYALAVVGFGIELLLTRAVFATGDSKSPALLEIVALAVYLGTILAFRDTSIQHGSVGLGFALSRTVKALLMAVVLWRSRARPDLPSWVEFVAKAGAAVLAGCVAVWLCRRLGSGAGEWISAHVSGKLGAVLAKPRNAALVLSGVASGVGVCVYAALLLALRVAEFRDLLAKLRRRRGPATA